MAILSTKKLRGEKRKLVFDSGISLVEYNAISIELISFKAPMVIENAIFTSQNAVLSIRESEIEIKNCFCVGEKTKSLLEKNGFNVIKMTEYASELAEFLVKNHQKDQFQFFCGNLRSEEIPLALKKNHIPFEEITVYITTLKPKQFEGQFDAILFYSPSGVQSFFEMNPSPNSDTLGICIGTTTASEAKKYMTNVEISNFTTIESVVEKALELVAK